jgi:hypothetical protein
MLASYILFTPCDSFLNDISIIMHLRSGSKRSGGKHNTPLTPAALEVMVESSTPSPTSTVLVVPAEGCSPSPDTTIARRVVVTKKRARLVDRIAFTQDHVELIESLGRQVHDIRAEVFMEVDRLDRVVDNCDREMRDVVRTVVYCNGVSLEADDKIKSSVAKHGQWVNQMDNVMVELTDHVHVAMGEARQVGLELDSVRSNVDAFRATTSATWQGLSAQIAQLRDQYIDIEARLHMMERVVHGGNITLSDDA